MGSGALSLVLFVVVVVDENRQEAETKNLFENLLVQHTLTQGGRGYRGFL